MTHGLNGISVFLVLFQARIAKSGTPVSLRDKSAYVHHVNTSFCLFVDTGIAFGIRDGAIH